MKKWAKRTFSSVEKLEMASNEIIFSGKTFFSMTQGLFKRVGLISGTFSFPTFHSYFKIVPFCNFLLFHCFLSHPLKINRTAEKVRRPSLFLFTISTRSQIFWHLLATLYLRWLPCIFKHIACSYQTATWWDLPPYRILDSCYSNLTSGTDGFEIALTITIALQANRLTKYASLPRSLCLFNSKGWHSH